MRLLRNPWTLLLIRFGALAAMGVWNGGFTFYGGIVVPILDDAHGQLDTGLNVTRHVTDKLNLIGVATLAAWWLLVWLETPTRTPFWSRGRTLLLAVSSACLAVLMVMHSGMDRHLDRQGVRDFKPSHRNYLMVSTAQWLANLGILGLSVGIWTTWDVRFRKETLPPSGDSTPKLG